MVKRKEKNSSIMGKAGNDYKKRGHRRKGVFGPLGKKYNLHNGPIHLIGGRKDGGRRQGADGLQARRISGFPQ